MSGGQRNVKEQRNNPDFDRCRSALQEDPGPLRHRKIRISTGGFGLRGSTRAKEQRQRIDQSQNECPNLWQSVHPENSIPVRKSENRPTSSESCDLSRNPPATTQMGITPRAVLARSPVGSASQFLLFNENPYSETASSPARGDAALTTGRCCQPGVWFHRRGRRWRR